MADNGGLLDRIDSIRPFRMDAVLVRHWVVLFRWPVGCSSFFYWVLLGFTGFYRVLPGFTGFYWVLLGFTGFYLVLLGFT